MASKRKEMVLALAFIVMTWHGACAQSTCTNAVMSLAPCSNYVTGSSLGPSSSCCSQLNSVIENQPECFCSLMNGGGTALGIVASQTMALALPGSCSLAIPSVGQCNVASVPTFAAASPASAPMGSQSSGHVPSDTSNSSDIPQTLTPTTPSQTTTPSSAGARSKIVPSTNNSSSGETITKSPYSVDILLLLVMSFGTSVARF